MWESDTSKLLTAIDRIIRDPDKKYDECMIEQFLKSVSDELQKLDHDAWDLQAQTILHKLQSFVDDGAFVMMNQARVYKTYLSVFRSNMMSGDSFATVRDHLESFWSSLGSVIINHDLAAVTAVLMTLGELIKSESVYKWIISRKFQPSISVLIRGREFEIEDIATLAEFYIETCENYHTKNKAELLMRFLMKNAIERGLKEDHQHIEGLKHITQKLIKAKSISILYILISILEEDPSSNISKALLEQFDIPMLLNERFMASSDGSQESLSTICKLLGLINDPDRSETILGQLQRKGQIAATIAFLSGCPGEAEKSLLQSYLLGPLAMRCGTKLDDEVMTLVQRLDSIKEQLSEKTVTTCLIQLERTLETKPVPLTTAAIALSVRILLNYIDNFSNTPREFKNVMLCCGNLSKFLSCDGRLDMASLLLVISITLETLQSIDIHDENFKPIVLGLIKLLSGAQRGIVSCDLEEKDDTWMGKVVDLASNCTDDDILEEFDLFLREFHKDYRPKPGEEVFPSQLEGELIQEEYRADIKSSLDDILDYELFSENILDCY